MTDPQRPAAPPVAAPPVDAPPVEAAPVGAAPVESAPVHDPQVEPAPVAPPPPAGRVEPPSPDVAPVAGETVLPGVHRGGFTRWPTAPIGVTPVVPAPTEPTEYDAASPWTPPPMPAVRRRYLAGWALALGIVALLVSLFVGWGLPIGIVGIVLAAMALQRRSEDRAMAAWALALSIASIVYSAGWLAWAVLQLVRAPTF